MIRAVIGSAETPWERIERLVAEGKMPREAVERAEQLWEERFQAPIVLPNGELMQVTRDDMYHAIVDPRIWRHPERIELALHGIFEIRAGDFGRRVALSQWHENRGPLLGVVIIEVDNSLRGIHVIAARKIRGYQRKYGEMLWTS